MSGKLSFRAALVAASLAALAALQVTSAQAADGPPPTPGTGRFGVLAQDCKEENMKVLREPGANDTDITIRVQVDERSCVYWICRDNPVAERACGIAAAKEACKTNPGGFSTAVDIKQDGQIFEGRCSK